MIRMRLPIRQSNLPASIAWVKVQQDENTDIYAIELMNLADKMGKIHISGKFFCAGTKLKESFFHTCTVILLYFSLESRLIAAMLMMFITSYFVTYCIYIPGNREFVFIIVVQFMMSANSRMLFGLQIVFICL